ncbi:MAG: thioredoxin family protein [Actinomycetota bacterium]|nr:thioredoxin family protein [Actinomycetota bacterium]
MKVEILYFDGCPTYKTASKTLREVLAEEGIDAEVELVAVNAEEDARRLRFPGSPTIRVEGKELFPVSEREDWRLGCRVYATPEGLEGSPTAEMLREALTKEGAADAELHR